MTNRVQQLLDYHGTRNFGTRENLKAQQQAARRHYAELSPEEQTELAERAIDEAGNEGFHSEEILCCLACLQPGCLAPFHERLVEQRILYPGVMFHGAAEGIASQILPLVEEKDHCGQALLALAWIGDETVVSAFATWRDAMPRWARDLYTPPEEFSLQAGWDLTEEGARRDLFSPKAFPLVPSPAETSPSPSVGVGLESEDRCPWCSRALVRLLEIEHPDEFLSGASTAKISVVTCDVCTCYEVLFSKGTKWHPANRKPAYLPPDASDWDPFPETPLVWTGQSRHYLEGADWSMLPGVSFSQVGGLPTWIQEADYPVCRECWETMPFVGQISNEDFMEYGEGIYYAFHCPDCAISATMYQQT